MKILHLLHGCEKGGETTFLRNMLTALNQYDQISICLLSNNPLNFKLDAAIPFYIHPMHLFNYGSVIEKLLHLIKQTETDILHCHGPFANMVGIQLSKHIPIKIVSTMHSMPHLIPKAYGIFYYYLKYSYHALLQKIPNWILLNTDACSFLKPDQHYVIIKNGIICHTVPPFSQAARNQLFKDFHMPFDSNALYFGMLGRMQPEKGFDLLIHQFIAISTKAPTIKLILAPLPALSAPLQKLIAPYIVSGQILILEQLSNPQLFYQLIDCLVVPSRSETFGYVIAEAGLNNKLVIASNVGGIPHLITPYESGLMFDINHPDQLGQLLLDTTAHFDDYSQYGQHLNHFINLNFNSNKIANEYHSFYCAIQGGLVHE